MDFTHCGELGVTVGGEAFSHLLFQFVLSHSGWRYAEVAYGETFSALVSGLQGALWGLGGAPEVVRTDNLSAATHDLRDSGGRAFNESYRAILEHYGLKATRTNPRSSHENGVAEQRVLGGPEFDTLFDTLLRTFHLYQNGYPAPDDGAFVLEVA